MNQNIRVHFMGIAGSGMAPIAIIAKELGYTVSGCDMTAQSYYVNALLEKGIEVLDGHSKDHLDNVDILAVTPAVFDLNPDHPELLEAKERGILMTWQEFAGRFLQKDKIVLAVAGTHGKSTTTALLGLMLEAGNLDPIVEAGTIINAWGGGYRAADSPYFVCEADEFNNNFHHYKPSFAILNNIEMDHPEFFADYEDILRSYEIFIQGMTNQKVLVVNEESAGIADLLSRMKQWIADHGVVLIGYYLNHKLDFPFYAEYQYQVTQHHPRHVVFSVMKNDGALPRTYTLGVSGDHNAANAMGVLAVAHYLQIREETIDQVFRTFSGVKRRFELKQEMHGIKVYDDYAHHPTEIAAVVKTAKECYPDSRIWAVMEPHQISRIRLFLNEFFEALNMADRIIITKTYLGREAMKEIQPVPPQALVERLGNHKADYIEGYQDVAMKIYREARQPDVVIVFGAGDSYKVTDELIRLFQGNGDEAAGH